MLYEVMKHIKNFFVVPGARQEGSFEIVNGSITGLSILEGQYFLVEGSVLNDGVHLYNESLKDETFTGAIVPLAVPNDFLLLVKEIKEYTENDKPGPFQSESFGGYSYSRYTDGKGGLADWTTVFKRRLNAWRKL